MVESLDMNKLICVLLTACVAMQMACASDGRLNVLIITGMNNHDWNATTESLKNGMEASGRFNVDVSLKPEEITAASIAKYDVLISNWNCFGKGNVRWGNAAEKAIEEFVKNGKGLTAFHAGGASMQDWDVFQEIVSGAWGKGTGHGPMNTFKVNVTEGSHPITEGLKSFETYDELWHNLAVLRPTKTRKVLATAYSKQTKKEEDIAVCTEYGKGRGFFLVLGHDAKGVNNPGAMQLMIRGVEWAATGEIYNVK